MTSKFQHFEAFVQWNMDWKAQMLREWVDWVLGREYAFLLALALYIVL